MKSISSISGLTLLELLVVIFILSMVAIGTGNIIGDGRVARARAAHRAQLALAAQGELDRLRSAEPKSLAEGSTTLAQPGAAPPVTFTDTIRKRPDGFLEVTVTAERQLTNGPMKVELVSIHPGGRP